MFPSQEEIESLLKAAIGYGTIADLWVNPDCGLKTRDYEGDQAVSASPGGCHQGGRASL